MSRRKGLDSPSQEGVASWGAGRLTLSRGERLDTSGEGKKKILSPQSPRITRKERRGCGDVFSGERGRKACFRRKGKVEKASLEREGSHRFVVDHCTLSRGKRGRSLSLLWGGDSSSQ